jgi:hypothetical protein
MSGLNPRRLDKPLRRVVTFLAKRLERTEPEFVDLTVTASNRLLIPGLINAHTHATVNLAKALADRCRRTIAQCLSVDCGRPHARVQAPLCANRRGRNGTQGLYGLLRPRRRDPCAVGRRHRGGCTRVRRRRHACGGRSDGWRTSVSTGRSPDCSTPCRRRCASARKRSGFSLIRQASRPAGSCSPRGPGTVTACGRR